MLKTQTNLNQNRSILFSCLQALKTLSAAVAQTPPVVITKCIQMVGVSCFFRHLLTKRLRTESISTIATPNPWRGTRYGAAAWIYIPRGVQGIFHWAKSSTSSPLCSRLACGPFDRHTKRRYVLTPKFSFLKRECLFWLGPLIQICVPNSDSHKTVVGEFWNVPPQESDNLDWHGVLGKLSKPPYL